MGEEREESLRTLERGKEGQKQVGEEEGRKLWWKVRIEADLVWGKKRKKREKKTDETRGSEEIGPIHDTLRLQTVWENFDKGDEEKRKDLSGAWQGGQEVKFVEVE